MKGKYLLLAVLMAVFLSSCKEISYTVPQPKGIEPLKSIPEKLQGHYLAIDEPTGKEADTLIIESWGYRLDDKDGKDWLGRGVLSDSLVVKFYQDYYFVNFKIGDQWVLRLIQQKPSGAIDFLSINLGDEVHQKEILDAISAKLKIKEIREIQRESDTFYQISPSRDQLMQMIKAGYFTGPELSKIQ